MTIYYFGDYKFGEGFQSELSKYLNPYIMGELKRTGKYTGQVKDGTEVLFCISLILSKNTAKITFVERQGKISKKGLRDAKQVAKILDRNGVDVTWERMDD